MQKEMTVVSLFYGISCGQIVLDRAGIRVKQYDSSTFYTVIHSDMNTYSIKVNKYSYKTAND